ncbi:hypothetical protein [Caballeronia sp. dw_19]|uniref:hypothetical protein n=1 Tax=Caballeronia sp. dw_19 TaxID=2719791 RepID=UPI001BD46599|nr:hypothetical protein [Caballeronia sp. dw_19]
MAVLIPFDHSPNNTLVAPSRLELEYLQKRLLTSMRDGLSATITLALAGVLAIMLLQAWALPDTTILGLQEIVGVTVFASCTWFMYERGEKKLHLYSFEPADHTMTGEIRALLNRLPGGAAYQQAIEMEQRAFTIGELEQIRARAREFSQTA